MEQLADAQHARELMDYQIAVSHAIADLEMARGRATDMGVLGGIEGALATTVLGVPAGAAQFDACAVPAGASGFGVHDGLLAVVALAAGGAAHALGNDYGATDVTMQDGVVLLHTPAAPVVAERCAARHAAAGGPGPRQRAAAPALYTEEQALRGEGLFLQHCASCHGQALQGVAAPALAGNRFSGDRAEERLEPEDHPLSGDRDDAAECGRNVVPPEYADVIAFLLASNCYPAGGTAFPTTEEPAFEHIQLQPLPGRHPHNRRPASARCRSGAILTLATRASGESLHQITS